MKLDNVVKAGDVSFVYGYGFKLGKIIKEILGLDYEVAADYSSYDDEFSTEDTSVNYVQAGESYSDKVKLYDFGETILNILVKDTQLRWEYDNTDNLYIYLACPANTVDTANISDYNNLANMYKNLPTTDENELVNIFSPVVERIINILNTDNIVDYANILDKVCGAICFSIEV